MSHQDGFGNNGPEATGLTKPNEGDNRMQKKSENVARAQDGIKLSKLKNSGPLVEFATDRSERCVVAAEGGQRSNSVRAVSGVRSCLSKWIDRQPIG